MTEQESGQIQAARYGMLSEVVLLMAKTADLQRLLKQLINKVKWVLDFNRCTLALMNEDGETYRLQTLLETRRDVPAVSHESIPLTDCIPGDVMRTRQMRLVTDMEKAKEMFTNPVDPARARAFAEAFSTMRQSGSNARRSRSATIATTPSKPCCST